MVQTVIRNDGNQLSWKASLPEYKNTDICLVKTNGVLCLLPSLSVIKLIIGETATNNCKWSNYHRKNYKTCAAIKPIYKDYHYPGMNNDI